MPPAFATAIDKPAGHAPAIGASRIGTLRPYLAQNAWVRSTGRELCMPVASSMPRSIRGIQFQLPCLANQILAKTIVRLLTDQAEACALVDAMRGGQNALRPERDLPVSARAAKANAFVHED